MRKELLESSRKRCENGPNKAETKSSKSERDCSSYLQLYKRKHSFIYVQIVFVIDFEETLKRVAPKGCVSVLRMLLISALPHHPTYKYVDKVTRSWFMACALFTEQGL